MHKCFLGIKKSFESRSVFSWACREGTDFSCIAAQECFILHLSYIGFWVLVLMCNISTSCCNTLQYSPVIPSGSPAQICTSAVNAPPPPMPSVLSDVQLTLRGASWRQSRSKACAEHHTSLPARFEMLWRTPNPQWGFGAFHLAIDHQERQASRLPSGGAS